MEAKDINICPDKTHNTAVLKEKYRFKDETGDIVERKVWEVCRNADYPEGIKYSVVFIHEGKRIVGYDNHEQKGHHKHIEDKEIKTAFISFNSLLKDFYDDLKAARKKLYGEENDTSKAN
jgi:hypothetical protein